MSASQKSMIQKIACGLVLFICSLTSLNAEIYEIRFDVENIHCQYCTRTLIDRVRKVYGVDQVKVWGLAGIGIIDWKKDTPFYYADIMYQVCTTPFRICDIEIDVEGRLYQDNSTAILHSLPDESIFELDAKCRARVKCLKNGTLLRIKGIVRGSCDRNYLTVMHIMPPVAPK